MSEKAPASKAPAESSSGGMSWNLGSALLPLFGSFLVSVLLAPYLGDAAWGEYSLVLSAATLLLIIAKFGVHAATSRLITENDHESGIWLRAGVKLRGLFTFAMVVVALVLAPWVASSFGSRAEAFWFVAPVVAAASFYEFGGEVLVGLRDFRGLFLNRLAFLALRLLAILVVRVGSLGVLTFLAGHSIAQIVPGVILLAWLWFRLPRPEGGAPSHAMRRTYELSVPLAFSSASYLVYAHTDRLMLGWFHTQSDVGQFAVARNVLDAALFPVTALAWTLRPALVRAVQKRAGTNVHATVSEGTQLAILYSLAAPALLAVFGPGLVMGLYQGDFPEAARLLVWMLPILALRGVGSVIFPALLAADAQRSYARLMVWTAVANVAANLALIPPFGSRGAVLGTVISLLPLTFGGFYQMKRELGTLGIGKHLRAHAWALVSVAAIAALAAWWLPEDPSLLTLVGGALVSTLLVLAANFVPLRRARSTS